MYCYFLCVRQLMFVFKFSLLPLFGMDKLHIHTVQRLFSIQILMYSAVLITVYEFMQAFAASFYFHKAKIQLFLLERIPKPFQTSLE